MTAAQKHSRFKILENKHNKMERRVNPQEKEKLDKTESKSIDKPAVEVTLPFIYTINT